MAVVGIVAAGGGAVFFQSYTRPQGSRLILGADTMEEAINWKSAIEDEITKLDRSRKPMLPSCADPNIISSIIYSGRGTSWRCIAVKESMRFLEQTEPTPNTLCRKAQTTVNGVPVSVFLAVMEGQHWPRNGKVKVDKVIDDHADVISVTLTTTYSPKDSNSVLNMLFPRTMTSTRTLSLTRFWRLDDDGVYLVTLNTLKPHDTQDEVVTSAPLPDAGLNVVITISPRKDHTEFEDDSLVTCVVQVSTNSFWKPGEADQVVNDILYQQLLDLRQSVMFGKYGFCSELTLLPQNMSSSGSLPEKRELLSMSSLRRGYSSPIDLHDSNKRPHDNHSDKFRQISGVITTQQPGLEDASMSSYNHNTAINTIQEYGSTLRPNANTPPSANVPLIRQRSVGIFRRKLDPSDSSEFSQGKAKVKRSSRRKSIDLNPEAASLRRQIDEKECELLQIEKMISKKVPTQASDTLEKQRDLINKLKAMKANYLNMTGSAYEAKRKKGFWSRVRGFRSQSPAPSPAAAPTLSSISTSIANKVSSDTFVAPSPTVSPIGSLNTITPSPLAKSIPSHWRRSVRLVKTFCCCTMNIISSYRYMNEETLTQIQRRREHLQIMLMTVFMFTVSMLSSMLIRYYISLLIT